MLIKYRIKLLSFYSHLRGQTCLGVDYLKSRQGNKLIEHLNL